MQAHNRASEWLGNGQLTGPILSVLNPVGVGLGTALRGGSIISLG